MLYVAVAPIFLLVASVTSHGVTVSCQESYDLPPHSDTSPSPPLVLNLEPATQGEDVKLNISWAIGVDVSIGCLESTRIVVEGGDSYRCHYRPPLATADLTGLTQVWFHHLEAATPGSILVQVANLPLPPLGSGAAYLSKAIMVPSPPPSATVSPSGSAAPVKKSSNTPTTGLGSVGNSGLAPSSGLAENRGLLTTVAMVMVLVGVVVTSCLISYRRCGRSLGSRLGFKQLQPSERAVAVLLVYPAEDSVFQGAVQALAHFLQACGGCSVAVDMWQRGRVGELGPIRWLAQQVEVAERVMVVYPWAEREKSTHWSSKHDVSGPAVPAAAHDLYPLALNMVASQARSSGGLAKFWVIQLGDQRTKRVAELPAELRTCRRFSLMKDLGRMCRSLHAHMPDGWRHDGPTVRLREAVEQLSLARRGEHLKSVSII